MLPGKIVHPNLAFPLYATRIFLSNAQIVALFTTAVEIVPAVAGYIHVVEKVIWDREAGSAYTANGATKLKLTYTNAAGIAIAHTFDLIILTDAGPFTTISSGPSSLSTQFASATPSSSAKGNSLVVGMDTAQATGGAGGITVTCFFRSFSAPYNQFI